MVDYDRMGKGNSRSVESVEDVENVSSRERSSSLPIQSRGLVSRELGLDDERPDPGGESESGHEDVRVSSSGL